MPIIAKEYVRGNPDSSTFTTDYESSAKLFKMANKLALCVDTWDSDAG